MKTIRFYLTALLLVVTASAFAQNITVKGTVTDAATGEGIPFASVVVKGTKTGTATDANGAYSITAPKDGILGFSFIGYNDSEIAIEGRALINVALTVSSEALDETVVVAYGTAKKSSFTGSAQSVKGETLEKRTVSNITKALDGLAAGVQTTSGSGQPGAGASVFIRGYGSYSASNTPLYVVDGIPYDGNLNAINSNDIESMTIIKDASAGALYGARGANGVVIITTKKGHEGAATVNFKGSWGVASRAIPRYEALDTYQWTEDVYKMNQYKFMSQGMSKTEAGYAALAEMTTGATKIFGDNEMYNPFSLPGAELIDVNTGKIKPGTTLKWNDDWLAESMADNPLRQEYQLSVNGGSDKNKYMFSLGYLDEEGLVKLTEFQRFSGRANIESQVKPWFKTGLNTNFAHNKTNTMSLGTSADSDTGYANVFYACELMAPIYPMYMRNPDGSYLLDGNGERQYDWGESRVSGASAGWNPIANLDVDKFNSASDNLSARSFVELGGLKDGILQGLKFTATFGFDYVFNKSLTYKNPQFGDGKTLKGYSYIRDGRDFSYTFNQLLTYDRTFGKHHVDLLAGHENYDYNYQYLTGYKSGFPFMGLTELAAATTLQDATSYQVDYKVESYLSRLNYDFDDKYYISGSFRRDGSSRFHQDYRWGNFWSAGASWRISQEEFMKSISWINNLTLKASYGVQGNDSINSYYAWQAFYDLGYANQSNPGAIVTSLENKNLKWEKNENLNVGIEARLFNRLSATVEYYKRYTKDMLMAYPMASSLGFSSYSKNIGNMSNEGVEISLSGDIIATDKARWTMTWMGSTVKNKVLHLADKPEIISGNYITREGETMNSFYLAESAGIDPATGNKLYWVWDEDENGNPGEKYITDDQTKATQCRHIAGSRMPKLYGSWQNEVRVGSFDFTLLTAYSLGGKILDGTYYNLLYNTYIGNAGSIDRLKAWQQPGDVTSIPRIDINGAYDIEDTDDNLTDASYFAIKNITLGYTLPSKWSKVANISSMRIFFTADNIHIFTARKGLNPQFNLSGGTGYAYTPSRTVSLGLDLTF